MTVLCDLEQVHVPRLKRIGCVDDGPDLRRVVEVRCDAVPVSKHESHNRRVVNFPPLFKLVQCDR